jgi:hypothetical protein
MEVKVACRCGQKFAFDVEPVNGRMPVPVSCPGCGRDGTPAANEILAQHFPNQAPPIPVAIAVQPAVTAAPTRSAGPLPTNLSAPAAAAAPKPQTEKKCDLGMGIAGAILGAVLGAGLMYGLFLWADFRFPFMGTGIGVLTGLGARILARGTNAKLGAIAGAMACLATGGTLYLMLGGFTVAFIISMIVSVSFAFKIAS